MAKLYRCPHCGGRGYTFSSTTANIHSPDMYSSRVGLKCKICQKKCFVGHDRKNIVSLVISAIFLISTVLLWLLFGFVDRKIKIIITLCFVGVYLVYEEFFSGYYAHLLPVVDDGNHNKFLETQPNCRVELNDAKYIRNMWVYGLKFETETKNVKFKERFEDGLVPAQFYPAEKGCTTYEIRIIGKEFVPDEILFEGTEFLVEDIDGIFITKGKVTKPNLDY